MWSLGSGAWGGVDKKENISDKAETDQNRDKWEATEEKIQPLEKPKHGWMLGLVSL